MYKKTLLSLAVASSVTLTGCIGTESGDDEVAVDPNAPSATYPAGSVFPIFDPAGGDLPIPNDLIFRGDDLETVGINEADGTFEVEDAAPPVTTALNRLSGGSTVAPTFINFNDTIDEASAIYGSTVFLIEVDYASGDPVRGLSGGEPPVPVGLAPAEIDVVTIDGKSTIRILPTEPLKPGTRYIAAVTKGVTAGGDPILPSPTYAYVTRDEPVLQALAPVQTLVNRLWEPVLDAALPIEPDDLAISYSFTTSADEKVLPYMAQPEDWFTDQLKSLVRQTAVRQVVGAANVLGAVAQGTSLEDALTSRRKSEEEVGPNDINRNGEIDALDFDFNGDGELTADDFNLSTTADTAESPFNYFDVEEAIIQAEADFPSVGLQAALPDLYGTGGACDGAGFDAGTACGGTALATGFAPLLPDIGDKSSSVTLSPLAESLPAALLTPAVASIPGSSTALVMQGSIELPYYLGTPSGTDGSAINDDIWTANHPLAEALNGEFGAVGVQLAQGAKYSNGDYASDVVNYLFPFPALTENLEVPMLVMVPRPGEETDGGVTWDGTSSLPVVVFQHGITTDRSAALSIGSALTSIGYGVVAIDLPIHGVDAQDNSDKTEGVTEERQALAATLLGGLDDLAAENSLPLPQQNTAANIEALLPDEQGDQEYIAGAVSFVVTNLGCDATATPLEIAGGAGDCASVDATAAAAQFVGFAIGAENAVANHTSVIPGIARTSNERHFDFTQGENGSPTQMMFDAGFGSSGSLYINLQNFFNSRDKNLQSQIDLVNVIASVGGIDVNGSGSGDFDVNNINLVGHSLGTVAGAGAAAVVNNTDINDVQATVLLTPASGITRLLENSPGFAPRILGGLQAAGLEPQTANYESFLRVVQHALDPADPINLADNILAGGKGIMTVNVVGTEDGNGNTLYQSDQTTPIEAGETQLNDAFKDLLVGGIPLSQALGATNVVTTDGTETELASNLAYGNHSMFVLPSPDSDIENEADREADFARQQAAFGEGIAQLSEFIMNGGSLVGPVDATSGRLGADGNSDNDPQTTPIMNDEALENLKQLN